MEGGQKTKIVIFSYMPNWHTLFQRPQQVALKLSEKGHNVVFFQFPSYLTPSMVVKNFEEKNFFATKKIAENLFVANLFLPPFRKSMRSISNKIGLLFINRCFRNLNFKPGVAIFYSLEYVFALSLMKKMGAKIVYDCNDDFSTFPGISNNSLVRKTEENLIKSSSLVIATSRMLTERAMRLNLNSHYVPNAVDFCHFNKATQKLKKPRDIENLHSPIIGFIGGIFDWVDIDLICKLAELHPDYSVLLVGPAVTKVDQFLKYTNIKMVGAKEYRILPMYLSSIDVCLIPFKVNKFTLAANPIKLYEYLAAGKPVVSTALPEVYKNGSEIVHVGHDSADFIKKVENAVGESKLGNARLISKRIEFAEANSWAGRINNIERLLQKTVNY